MPITTFDAPVAPMDPWARQARGGLVAATLAGAAVTLVALALAAGLFDLKVARVKNVEVYVTAVGGDQTSIGYADAPGGDVLGTYDLRALDVWANGEDGAWVPVGSHVEDGRPTCIPPGSYGAKVRLTLVASAFGGPSDVDRVARLRCLSPGVRGAGY